MNSRASPRAIGGRPILIASLLAGHRCLCLCRRAVKARRRCSRATSASPCFRAITIMSATAPTRRSTGWSAICCARALKVRVYSPTVDKPAFPPTGDLVACRLGADSRAGANIGSPTGTVRRASAATSPNSRPTSSISPAPTSSPTARSAGRGRATSRRSPRSTRASKPIFLITICSSSSRRCARSCGGSTGAAMRSSRRPNRPRRCCAPSA